MIVWFNKSALLSIEFAGSYSLTHLSEESENWRMEAQGAVELRIIYHNQGRHTLRLAAGDGVVSIPQEFVISLQQDPRPPRVAAGLDEEHKEQDRGAQR